MASVKKSTLPLKLSVNPRIAATTIAKPIVKQTLVSKVASPVIMKKSAVTVKTASEKITAVKSTTLLKSSTIKSAVPSSPAKMTTTKSPTVPSSVKVSATPVKSAADSTSTLKVKSVVKPSAKTSSTALTKPTSKLITSTPAVKKPTTIASKSTGVTAAKSTTVVITTPKVSAVKSSNVSTPVKARSLSITNTKTAAAAAAAAVTKTSKPIASKNPPSTVGRMSTKLTSTQLPPKSTKAIVGAKVPLKSSTAVKPATRTTAASAKRATPKDVIKRVQDASEIEIRDADSTTTLEEKEVEECISKDTLSCENSENCDAKQKSEVDEERVYAVAEQLICVMQPEELEVITGDVVEQLNKDSYVIDMSAVEAQEINAEASLTDDTNDDSVPVLETPLQTLSKDAVTNIKTVSDVRNTTVDEKATIFEEREMNTQEITNMDCSANDVLEMAENTPADEESAETGSLIDAQETEFPPLASAEDEEMTSFVEQDALGCDEPNDDDQNELLGNALCPSVDVENVLENDTCSGVPVLSDAEFETRSEVEPTANDTSDESEKLCSSGAEFEVESSEANECEQLVNDDIQPATEISFSGFTDESNECEELMSSSSMVCEMTTLHNEEQPESGYDIIASNMDKAKVDEPVSVEMCASLVDVDNFSENSVEPEPTNFHEISINFDQTEELICLDISNDDECTTSATDESEFSTPNEQSIVVEQRSENFMAFGNFEDVINISYADIVLSSKMSSDDLQADFQCLPLIHVPHDVDDIQPHSADVCAVDNETAENREVSSVTVIDSDVGSSIPIYSIYDNTEFPDAVPSDEHYEKQDHEVDQHDETFHKIRHKRNKRRNKKNRKSVSSSENVEEESPKNVYSEKPNHQAQQHGRSRRNSRRWRNTRAYFEAFHQPQQSHQQEYYRDSHWKYTDAKSD